MIETLETDRLLMRPFERSDLPALTALHAEESFWWFGLRRGMTPEETASFLARVMTDYGGNDPAVHAVVERSTGELAGWVGLAVPRLLPEVLPAIEVGWRLGSRYRGRGYATEAAGAALRWGFEDLGLAEILSIFERANVASGKVMDHLGFDAGFETVDPHDGAPLVVRALTAASWRRTRPGATGAGTADPG